MNICAIDKLTKIILITVLSIASVGLMASPFYTPAHKFMIHSANDISDFLITILPIIFIVKLQDVKSPEDYSTIHKCVVIAVVAVGCLTLFQLVLSIMSIIRSIQ